MTKAFSDRNIIAQRSLIPATEHRLQLQEQGSTVVFVTGVFAIDASASVTAAETWEMWQNRPTGRVVVSDDREQIELIST